MFENLTEETATGTGNTITLTGATSGMVAFSKSFADGDYVAYLIEDSGGTIKVAGIGTYNTAGNTITRADTWHWNGTAIDKNPSSNPTLSAGTHTVRCTAIASGIYRMPYWTPTKTSNSWPITDNWITISRTDYVIADNSAMMVPYLITHRTVVSNFLVEVTTANATTSAGVGLFKAAADDLTDFVLIEQQAIDVTTTGVKTIAMSSSYVLEPGWYFVSITADDQNASFRAIGNHWGARNAGGYQYRGYANGFMRKNGYTTSGVFPTGNQGVFYPSDSLFALMAVLT